jgi:hypothetical protein
MPWMHDSNGADVVTGWHSIQGNWMGTSMKLSTGLIHRLLNTPKSTLKLDRYLTSSIRSQLVGEPLRRIARKRCLVLLAALCIATATPANATKAAYSIDHLKLYAHSRILDYKEFQCFNRIITKESRWSYLAKNGSHFGLGQMKSQHYRDLDPFRQIDASLRYISKRYQTPCKAWAFHQERNYY